MSRRSICALAVLLAALVACGNANDSAEASGGESASSGNAGNGAASGLGGANTGSGGKAGRSQGGAAGSGGGTNATGGGPGGSGATGGGSAGHSSAGGLSGAGGGSVASGGRAGSAPLGGNGGRGGEAASAGRVELAGAGGDAGEPSSSCTNPLDTVDVSRLVASEAFDPYVVTGNSANQIRQSINQNRGMDYDAYTGWYVSWRFGDCAGNGLVVTVDVTYDYPEWQPSVSASSELVASWSTYIDALFCHEYGHTEHALDCANDVYTALAAIDAGGDCSKQQAAAEAAFSTILDEYNQLDVQYDADTNHGATMGAVFPP